MTLTAGSMVGPLDRKGPQPQIRSAAVLAVVPCHGDASYLLVPVRSNLRISLGIQPFAESKGDTPA
jgi:hypothetical protein